MLRQFGALLQGGTRREDVPCRLGGEEFVLLLPGMSVANALARGEEIRRRVEALTVPSPQGEVRATISIGVAGFPSLGEHLEDLIKCADLALYAVKRSGRNGVRAYGAELGKTLPT